MESTVIHAAINRDNWAGRAQGRRCERCIHFVAKGDQGVGRCRRHAPTLEGWPVVMTTDWCGDFKLQE